MSETKETKITRKSVLITLGIICIILVACLGGVVAAYILLNSSVANLRNQVASDNSKIDSLTSQVKNLQNQFSVEGVNEQLGLKLTMALQKITYSLGEPISITLTITNISNQTKTIYLGAYNDFDFRVYNGTNSTMYQWSNSWLGGAVPQIVRFQPLNAGESLSANFAWHQTCYNYGLSEGVPVSPGAYYIVGQIGSVLSAKNSTIETTPIQITID